MNNYQVWTIILEETLAQKLHRPRRLKSLLKTQESIIYVKIRQVGNPLSCPSATSSPPSDPGKEMFVPLDT
jgi:hypothetical protein